MFHMNSEDFEFLYFKTFHLHIFQRLTTLKLLMLDLQKVSLESIFLKRLNLGKHVNEMYSNLPWVVFCNSSSPLNDKSTIAEITNDKVCYTKMMTNTVCNI